MVAGDCESQAFGFVSASDVGASEVVGVGCLVEMLWRDRGREGWLVSIREGGASGWMGLIGCGVA